ncbi:MAG: 5'-nucleotidase C-terminal domain-containing protein [Spirochaetales bacterium]|jgi:5'-nucleotidase/UDP-sugar diphosphatase|nr:5'-nucleotidase C-terminal domain-containing protein [Spirochaetales bacterium]
MKLSQKRPAGFRSCLAALAAAVILALIGGCAGGPKPVPREAGRIYELTVLHTNDHHGTILPNGGRGGLAERAAFIKQVRAANPQVLLIDAGDINTGSALSNMFLAEPDFLSYNLMGYDAATFGNHEFDSNQANLLKQISQASFPILSSNIITAEGNYLGPRYLIKDYEGFRVGLFGITTLRTQVIASPDKSLTFVNEIEAAREVVEILRNQELADIIIGITHIGDVKEGPEHITSPELAEAVPGIDLIIDGHSHSFFAEPLTVGSTYIVSANEWGKFVGQGKLQVADGRLVSFEWQPVEINTPDVKTFEPDPEVTALLAPYIEEADASLKEVVGEAAGEFVFGNRLTRYQETSLGNLVTDANVWYFRSVYNQHIDFAFHNGGNIRAGLPAGPITRESILTILPFDNYLYIVSIKGEDLLELFNYIASIPQGNGAFPQFSQEVRYTVNKNTNTLTDLTVNGAPVDPGRLYRFCTNSYLLEGGDGYTVLQKSIDPFNTSLLLSYVVVEYIKSQNGVITPVTDGRLRVIGGVTP